MVSMEKSLKLEILRAFWRIINMEIGSELLLSQCDNVCKFKLGLVFSGDLAGRSKSFGKF
jgi:hypothetical protein